MSCYKLRRVGQIGVPLLLALLIFFPSALIAQTTTSIPIGERVTLSAIGTCDKITSLFYGRRSYCCTLLNFTTIGLPAFSSAESFQGLAAASLTPRGKDGDAACHSLDDCVNRRQCWYEDPIDSTSSAHRFILEQHIFGNQPVDVLCQETTLVGGFNTMVSDFNFLELSATAQLGQAAEGITGYVILKRTIGGQTTTLPFSLSFGGRAQVRQDFAIHDLIENANDFGQVVVIHNGAPGVVKARVSQYRVTSVEPLVYEPVLQEVLVPRVE